jgi:hypothetical protein
MLHRLFIALSLGLLLAAHPAVATNTPQSSVSPPAIPPHIKLVCETVSADAAPVSATCGQLYGAKNEVCVWATGNTNPNSCDAWTYRHACRCCSVTEGK